MNTFAGSWFLFTHWNPFLAFGKEKHFNPFIYSKILICIFLKEKHLNWLWLFIILRSPGKGAYILIHSENCTVLLFQERTPSRRVRRSGAVAATEDSHEVKQEVYYQKFALEEIFQKFLRPLIPKYDLSIVSMKCNGRLYIYCSCMLNVYLCTKICIFIRTVKFRK